MYRLFCNTTAVSNTLPIKIRDANNVTPTTISATNTPVDSTGAGHDEETVITDDDGTSDVDETSKIDAMNVSITEGEC